MTKITAGSVIKNLDSSMAMKTGDWLEEQLSRGESPVLLDLRSKQAWEKSHISGSKQINIQELPEQVESLIPNPDSTVICICNGSVQSAMAIIFLRTEGYRFSFNLSGGFSSWEKNERPVESSI